METNQSYVKKMKFQLNEWQKKIDELIEQADQLKADQKNNYYEQIDKVRAQKRRVQNKLADLEYATGNARDELKTGVELAWQDLQLTAQLAYKRLKFSNKK